MNLPPEAIERLMRSCDNDAKRFSQALHKIDDVRRNVDAVRKKMGVAKEKYELALADLDAELDSIRQRCGHEWQTYHGDPAGGSDSCHICEICGKEL